MPANRNVDADNHLTVLWIFGIMLFISWVHT